MFEKTKILASKFRLDSLAQTNYQIQLNRISKGKIAVAQTKIFSDSKKEDLEKRQSCSKKFKKERTY